MIDYENRIKGLETTTLYNPPICGGCRDRDRDILDLLFEIQSLERKLVHEYTACATQVHELKLRDAEASELIDLLGKLIVNRLN